MMQMRCRISEFQRQKFNKKKNLKNLTPNGYWTIWMSLMTILILIPISFPQKQAQNLQLRIPLSLLLVSLWSNLTLKTFQNILSLSSKITSLDSASGECKILASLRCLKMMGLSLVGLKLIKMRLTCFHCFQMKKRKLLF